MDHVIRSTKVAAVIACLCLGLVSSGSRAQQNNTISATNFTFQAKLTANDGTAESFFGGAVAISGDTAIAFAKNVVYVFVRSGNTWTQQAKLIPSDGIGVATSSNAAAISGDTVVIGGSSATVNSNTSQGAAYVFARSGTTWTEQQRLTASDGAAQDQFGSNVSINGDSIIVGAEYDDIGSNTDQGSAYIYVRQGGAWTEQAKLVANDGAANGLLGYRVSISGDTAAVSSSNFSISSVSHAYVFFRSGTNWSQQANVSVCEPHSPHVPCRISSLAVNGDTLIFGDMGVNVGNNTFQGAAYVFIRSGTTWSQQQRLVASDGQTDDAFGRVAIEGDTVVVGSRGSYIFTRSGNIWTEQQKLLVSSSSVSISGNTILVGDTSDTINGNTRQGSAFVYVAPSATPSTVQFDATNYSKSEGGGSTNITVTRTGDASGSSSVDYRTGGNSYVACNVVNGSAAQNCDFIVSAGTLSFEAGQTSKTFPVLIFDDTYVEGDETLSLTLSNPVGATLGSPSTATLTIVDNDTAGLPSPGPKTFVAALASSQEVPPTGTTGKGGGVVQLDAGETSGKVGLLFSNLSSSETAAHIHGPAAVGVNGPILFPLPLGTVIDFGISPTAQQVSDLKAGLHYLNVHSGNFPGGETRGQLLWNPLNEAQYFVTQHYYDFLGRLPDQGGLDYWTNEITLCGTNVQCLRDRSVGVSNAFFYEDEYQQTASFVFLLYRASYGDDQPFPNPDPANATEAKKLPGYLSFVRDRAQVVGGTDLAATQLALASNFVQRPEFVTKYPMSLATGEQFVDAVLATIQSASGVNLASTDPNNRPTLITHFNNGGRGLVMFHLANDYWNGCNRLPGSPSPPCVPAGFGAAVDNRPFIDAEYNRSFVYSQYSGYLRRDSDIDGFIFWLNQVSAAPPRNVAKQHGMVCAFITSEEYQFRFGNKAPRTNAECIP